MIMLMMLVVAAVTASAEELRYQVKYTNEYNRVLTAEYVVNTDFSRNKPNPENVVEYRKFLESKGFKIDEYVIDEDFYARHLAVVNKLDTQGYLIAYSSGYLGAFVYHKINGVWRLIYIHK